jgi:glycosyltransferase involved in cell wall biosynthesis
MKTYLKRIARRLLEQVVPHNSKRRLLLKRAIGRAPTVTIKFSYGEWIRTVEPDLFHQTAVSLKAVGYKPFISIVLPCYNTPKRYVDQLLESVLNQVYQNWELCLVDGSTDKDAAAYLKQCATQDKRIRYTSVGENLGIVGNTNIGLESSRGEFIAFMDHDDTLSPYALAEVVLCLNQKPETDLVYSDEDKLSDDGKQRLLPFFKPDWSPDLLLGVNYITHFVVARATLVKNIGGLRKGFDGAQDYDFLLRFSEKTDHIEHIAKILYHWRLAEGSTAKTVGEKSYADTAGQRALRDVIKRRKLHAKVIEIPERPTNYRLNFLLPSKQPKVSVIIPFKDKADLLKTCTTSIFEKTTYQNYELILLSNNSVEPETKALLAQLKQDSRCKVYEWNETFNFSKINNFGVSKASGEFVVLLNNDTEVITPSWLEELVGVAAQKGVGAVGPMLLYPDQKNGIQHAGIILGMNTMAGHVFRHRQPGEWTDFGSPDWPRNYLAITAACLAIKKSLYERLGGLDEIFTVAGQDVAFGIKLHEAGYRNIYWPFARLYHYESVSVVTYNNGIQLDYDHSLDYYRPYLNWHDPYFNSNLDLMVEQITLRKDYHGQTH